MRPIQMRTIKMRRITSLFVPLLLTLAAAQAQSKPSASKAQTAPKASKSAPTEQVAVLVGAGDIASCDDLAGAEATAKLIDNIPGTVFAAGDLAYPSGTDEQFEKCYGPTWGRFKDRTRPAPGNHEYRSNTDSGYLRYWGAAAGDSKGYYSYDLAAWHVIVLNSECEDIGGCGAGSPQEQWLRQDLAAHPAKCTLAYWHKPLFSSGKAHGNDPEMKPFWDALYAANADVVLNGHDHDYERFAPQDPQGNPDAQRGIREFVVGTGGKNAHRKVGAAKPNSEVRQGGEAFGVLKLTLRVSSYDWEFIPEAGKKFSDAGSGACH